MKIGDEYVSQLMFVIGTDGSGLEHNNWVQNLRFAIKVQEKANAMYPGLFKPIIIRNSRYNQHLAKAASIIEVGATGNTLEQSNNSMKYLAKVLSEIMKYKIVLEITIDIKQILILYCITISFNIKLKR